MLWNGLRTLKVHNMANKKTELKVLKEEKAEVEKLISDIDDQIYKLTVQKDRMSVLRSAFALMHMEVSGKAQLEFIKEDQDLEGEQDPNSE